MSIDRIVTSEEINSLIEQIEHKKTLVNRERPVNRIALQKLQDEFVLRGICNSMRLEGVKCSERETRVLLRCFNSASSLTHDELEILNLSNAVRFIESNLDKKLSVGFINEVHKLVTINTMPYENCGVLRNSGVIITGSEHTPPHSSKVLPMLLQSIAEFNSNPTLLGILKFKHDFTRIHPYFNGNGRTSRLLLNFLLLKHKYIPVIISSDSQAEYYDVLEYADLYMDYRRYYYFMLKQIDNTYSMYLDKLNILTQG